MPARSDAEFGLDSRFLLASLARATRWLYAGFCRAGAACFSVGEEAKREARRGEAQGARGEGRGARRSALGAALGGTCVCVCVCV